MVDISRLPFPQQGRKAIPDELKVEIGCENRRRYIVSARLLCDCFRHLNRDYRNESIVDISGIRHGGIFVMERMEDVEHESSSAVHARTDLQSTFRMLMTIDAYGGLLAGVFHIHPGKGVGSTEPSGADLVDQARRERAGMNAIGGIFSRDGFIRFFSCNMPFQVQVIGKGVKEYGEHILKIERTGDFPHKQGRMHTPFGT
jgi:proteasome lid subunit RPN8/RPN11